MAKSSGPSQPTVKRLFAVSGNRCAFPKCSTCLIDSTSGSVVGDICHVNGKSPDAPRYDPSQTDKERHGFGNLILLCKIHHKIVDDDELAYTVDRLRKMKNDHESRADKRPSLSDELSKQFVDVAIENSKIDGSVITTHSQSGGQAAHVIYNNYGMAVDDSPIQLEGKLDVVAHLELIAAIGCPGMRLTVVNRGTRSAKIRRASLAVDGVDEMRRFQAAFGTDFDHKPLEGSTETLLAELIPLSPRNSPNGVVLERDDACQFFYPPPSSVTEWALRANPESVSITVELFDGSEMALLSGSLVTDILRSAVSTYQQRPGDLKVGIVERLQVSSLNRPNVSMVGQVNPNPFPDHPPQ